MKKGFTLESEIKVSLSNIAKSLGSFKIPKGKPKPVVKEIEEENCKRKKAKKSIEKTGKGSK